MTAIGDKVAHVKAARQIRGHHCHWPGCTVQVPPAMWGCRKHWYTLPLAIRRLIWATYSVGQEIAGTPSAAYLVAATKAQDWIRQYIAAKEPL
jgi:hypothetical protein